MSEANEGPVDLEDHFDTQWRRLGMVIDQFNALEHEIAALIVNYVRPAPERAGFVEATLLHNQVVPFASKVKLLLAIRRECGGPKVTRDKLHRLLKLRNAVAHTHMLRGIRANRNALAYDHDETYFVVETLGGDLSVEEVPRDSLAQEFYKLKSEVRDEIRALSRHILDLD